jgi:hypothetical protein
MPKINYQLASQRLNTGGRSGGVQPDLLSGASSTSLGRSPQINTNSANVRYTSRPVPKLTIDTSLQKAAQASQVITQAAFDYQDREAQAKADTVFLQLQNTVKNMTRKYGSMKGAEATANYGSVIEALKNTVQETVQSQEHAVREKLVLPAKKLQNAHADAVASHKVQQFEVEQTNILENKQGQFINDLAGLKDPVQIHNHIEAYNANLAQEHGGRSDYVELRQQEFKDRAYKSIISSYLNVGNYEQAGELIEAATEHKANPETLTALHAKLESGLIAEERNETRAIKAEQDMYEQQQKKIAAQAGKTALRALDDGDYRGAMAAMSLVDDLQLRGKLINTVDNINKGLTPQSDDSAKLRLNRLRPQIAEKPEMLLNENFFPDVSPNDKLALYVQMNARRDNRVSSLKTDAVNWVDTIVKTEVEEEERFNPWAASVDKKADALKNRLIQQFDDTIDEAVAKGESPEIAFRLAKSQILSDTDQYTNEQLEIQETALAYIEDDAGYQVGMRDVGSRIVEGPYPNLQEAKTRLDAEYGRAVENIVTKYGIDPNILAGGNFQGVLNSINDRETLRDILQDTNMLSMQRRYFNAKLEKEFK